MQPIRVLIIYAQLYPVLEFWPLISFIIWHTFKYSNRHHWELNVGAGSLKYLRIRNLKLFTIGVIVIYSVVVGLLLCSLVESRGASQYALATNRTQLDQFFTTIIGRIKSWKYVSSMKCRRGLKGRRPLLTFPSKIASLMIGNNICLGAIACRRMDDHFWL